jgi:hypothetical protein
MHHEPYESDHTTTRLSMALGWLSLALGAAELLAPRQLARLVGVDRRNATTGLLRAYGAREIASGIAILSQPNNPRWLWSRVGGDAIDLATLGSAAGDENADHGRLSLAAAAVMGVTALDVLCARRLSHSESSSWLGSDFRNEQAMTVRAPLEQAEEAWMQWCMSGDARLKQHYAVRFEPAPAARGTEVHLSGEGRKGTFREELRRFKQFVETGEIPVSDGPGLWRPAQPPANPEELKAFPEVLK